MIGMKQLYRLGEEYCEHCERPTAGRLEIAYMIKQTLDLRKDVESEKSLSPREFRKRLWHNLEELDQFLQPYRQREIEKKIQEIESKSGQEPRTHKKD